LDHRLAILVDQGSNPKVPSKRKGVGSLKLQWRVPSGHGAGLSGWLDRRLATLAYQEDQPQGVVSVVGDVGKLKSTL